MITETGAFIKQLKLAPITKQQRRTLRGQAIAGDLSGAQKGLSRVLLRKRENAPARAETDAVRQK